MTTDLASKIWECVGVEIAPHIENKFNYKQFAGLAAITERIFCWNFCKGDKAGPTAPKVNVVINKKLRYLISKILDFCHCSIHFGFVLCIFLPVQIYALFLLFTSFFNIL